MDTRGGADCRRVRAARIDEQLPQLSARLPGDVWPNFRVKYYPHLRLAAAILAQQIVLDPNWRYKLISLTRALDYCVNADVARPQIKRFGGHP